MGRHHQGQRTAGIEVADDPVVDPFVQIQPSVERNLRAGFALPCVLLICGDEPDEISLGAGLDHGVGILVDRGIQRQPAIAIAIRRHVGAATAQPQPQRCPGPDDHRCPTRRACADTTATDGPCRPDFGSSSNQRSSRHLSCSAV